MDLSKAFEYSERNSLWSKFNNTFRKEFSCFLCVRQGESLYPVSVSMFINDIKGHIVLTCLNGIALWKLKIDARKTEMNVFKMSWNWPTDFTHVDFSSESLGFHKVNGIERIHTQYCILISGKILYQNKFVYGALGRFDFAYNRYIRTVKYWLKITNSDALKYCKIIYEVIKTDA
ncbi:hypothetical protein MAR_016669, partial [Mya arenaria]